MTYHNERSNNPVHHYGETYLDPDLAVLEDKMQCFVFDFAKNRIHHNQESDS